MSLKTNSVFRKLFPYFIFVLLFCSVLVINCNAEQFSVTQSQFNSIQPYTEFQILGSSGYYTSTADSGFSGSGSFDLHRFNSFSPNSNGGLTVSNYGINTVKTMWRIPVNIKKGETFSCSFDITFDLSPVTNFLPNAVSFFFGPSGDEFIGFNWADDWSNNPYIYHIPRTSTIQKSVAISSSYSGWFPSSYLGTTVSPNEKATVSGTFTYSGYIDEDTDHLWMVMFANPIIRHNGYWTQFTDHVQFTISNFLATDGNSAITNGLLGDISDGIGDINENLGSLNNSLHGSVNESFDSSKIDKYQQKDTEIESMYNDALDKTSTYFDDLFTISENAFIFRGVKFFGSCLSELFGITQPFYRLLIVSLCLGFFATLLSIGVSLSNSNKFKSEKKGGRGS